jgi:hypothetical protein
MFIFHFRIFIFPPAITQNLNTKIKLILPVLCVCTKLDFFKEDEVGGTCGTHGRGETEIVVSVGLEAESVSRNSVLLYD